MEPMEKLKFKIKSLGCSSSSETLQAVLALCEQLYTLPQLDDENRKLALYELELAMSPAWRREKLEAERKKHALWAAKQARLEEARDLEHHDL